MIKEISPLLEEKEYAYDGKDNLISVRDEEQQKTTVSYSLNNKPVSVTYGDRHRPCGTISVEKGMFRNPRNGCGSESPFDTGL